MTKWRLINYSRHNAFENMAIDEAIFRQTIKNKAKPTIRFYGWNPAAVSIGYFQDIQSALNLAQCSIAGIDVVRRLTGGKAVFHNDEITYCVTACAGEETFPGDILGTYKVVSDCLAKGLSYLGIKANLSNNCRTLKDPDLMPCCFSAASRYELLVNGRKICGSAQTRTKGGFLQHGSLLINFDPLKALSVIISADTPEQLAKLREAVVSINELIVGSFTAGDICSALQKGFAEVLGIEIIEESLTDQEISLKNELISKYKDLQWNINAKIK